MFMGKINGRKWDLTYKTLFLEDSMMEYLQVLFWCD